MDKLKIGQKVSVKGEPGTIRFLGATEFAAGEWVGVELDNVAGKNDGSLNEVRYFRCRKQGNYGVFVRPSMLNNESKDSGQRVLEVHHVVEKLQVKLRAARQEIDDCKKKLQQKTDQIEELEARAEEISVDSDYLKTHNSQLSHELEQLQSKYNDLEADYEILREELELHKDLEAAVEKQMGRSESFSPEDYLLLLQHNKKLELAVSSLKSIFSEKEKNFTNEIETLNSNNANSKELQKSLEITQKKLQDAETTISHLQEQLESVAELDLIIERLTSEIENLNVRNAELTETVNELQEIHEIDKSLEENLRKVELDLKSQIDDLLQQIKLEGARVEEEMAKSRQLQERLELATTDGRFGIPNTNENEKLAVLNLEIKKLSVELENYQINSRVNEHSLGALFEFDSLVAPLEFESLFSALRNLKIASSITSEISSWMTESHKVGENTEILCHIQAINLCLSAVGYHLTYEFENSAIDLGILDRQLITLQSFLRKEFERLHLADSTAKKSLHSHLAILQNFSSSAKLPQTISYYNLSKIAQAMWSSNALSGAILQHIPNDLEEFNILTHLKKLKDQSDFLLQQTDTAFRNIANAKGFGLPSIKNYDFPILSKHLESCLTSLIADSEMSSEAMEIIIKDNISYNDLHEYTLKISQILQEISLEPLELSEHQSIFEHFKGKTRSTLNDKRALPNDAEKDRVIGDLKLKLDLVEKNMSATIEGKSLKISELHRQLQQTKTELKQLEEKNAESLRAQKVLEDELQHLLELNALRDQNMTRMFEDLKSRKGYTKEMALLDELTLLRKMISVSDRTRGWDPSLDWLAQPLIPDFNFKQIQVPSSFESRARDVRRHASRLLQHILNGATTPAGVGI